MVNWFIKLTWINKAPSSLFVHFKRELSISMVVIHSVWYITSFRYLLFVSTQAMFVLILVFSSQYVFMFHILNELHAKETKCAKWLFLPRFHRVVLQRSETKKKGKKEKRNHYKVARLSLWIHDHHYPSFNHLCSDRVHADTVQTENVGFLEYMKGTLPLCRNEERDAPHARTLGRVKQANQLVKLAIKKEPKQRININTFAVHLSRSLRARRRRGRNSKNFCYVRFGFLGDSVFIFRGIFVQMLITFPFCRRVFPFICLLVRGSWMLYET